MILLLIILALFLWGAYIIHKSSDSAKPDLSWIKGYCFFGLMVGLVLYMGLSVILTRMFGEYTKECDISIVSISASSQISGDFVLGTGSINGVRCYYYKVQHEDGGIKEYYSPVRQSTLYETDENPHVITYRKTLSKDITYIPDESSYYNLYKFYVPKGCIIKEFNIN